MYFKILSEVQKRSSYTIQQINTNKYPYIYIYSYLLFKFVTWAGSHRNVNLRHGEPEWPGEDAEVLESQGKK